MLATNDFYAVATLVILVPIGIVRFIRPPQGPLKVVSGH
ncbi:MAG: hypothetical protein JWO82_278 [Akkermansiaceae bacterium]|nr:hypothetical protein [Akkermansiaceae bacterium]